ncbi:hypothetical protein PPSIR1_26778 [Plesiocystis pacifica SIR-1]|uniref:Lipoprotein n=1 Tax=Plesiocystis pacifica SIR-1 TaxID=391625 RepID=A6GAC1_9BACT|nr:hypothetical protein [Plesiocystis pacifica]EDM77223.1 hypothetical protein PPSIR1_26778 [Plesiocystis pacifica SIR-1]
MKHHKLLGLACATVLAATTLGCADTSELDGETQPGELLFDLEEDELARIHATYLGEEDIALTRDRLTAPFDCELYDDLCAQVGEQVAYELTGELVDLALEGVSLEELEAYTDARIDEAVALADELEAQGEAVSFRASGSWYSHTIGNYRLMVRNGVTTPVIGDRRAWTEAKTQKKSLGIWSAKNATQLCVNAGTNTQTFTWYTSTNGSNTSTIESINPSNACSSSIKTKTETTYHDRNNGIEGSGIQSWYTIRANGCATAEFNGNNFSRCAAQYTKIF